MGQFELYEILSQKNFSLLDNVHTLSVNSRGVIATIRASRGEDIEAACGMLSGKESAN